MRLLALLPLAALLAGCASMSMPYQGTSFKAVPKAEHHAEAEGHHEGGEGVVEGEGFRYDALPTAQQGEKDRVGLVFPNTAQPGE